MQYTCVNARESVGKGFVVTRTPQIIDGDLPVSFLAISPGYTAIFEDSSGRALYRTLVDNACVIPENFLAGEIKVTLAILDGESDSKKYVCEPFYVERKNGVVLVYPNWLDLPMQIIELYSELQGVKDDMGELSGRYSDLDEKVDKLLDGYDFD